jgi:hypothetical protein
MFPAIRLPSPQFSDFCFSHVIAPHVLHQTARTDGIQVAAALVVAFVLCLIFSLTFLMQPAQSEDSNHFVGIKRFRQNVVCTKVQNFRPYAFICEPGTDDQERDIVSTSFHTFTTRFDLLMGRLVELAKEIPLLSI